MNECAPSIVMVWSHTMRSETIIDFSKGAGVGLISLRIVITKYPWRFYEISSVYIHRNLQ